MEITQTRLKNDLGWKVTRLEATEGKNYFYQDFDERKPSEFQVNVFKRMARQALDSLKENVN